MEAIHRTEIKISSTLYYAEASFEVTLEDGAKFRVSHLHVDQRESYSAREHLALRTVLSYWSRIEERGWEGAMNGSVKISKV